jgi:NitT/TauT family transport system ATP-binding protein
VSGVAIDLNDVSVSFAANQSATAVRALEGVDASIAPGEFVSLLGASGCGKSTLIRLIAGLLTPTQGTVHLDGQPVAAPYTQCGIVFQSDLLLDWRTAVENVLFQVEMRGLPKKKYTRRAEDLLALVGLSEFKDRYPAQLSGGMRQRVAICRALLLDSPLLLMDEPFGALDAITRDQLNVDIQGLLSHRPTVVFVTHSMDEAIFLSDRIFVMSPRPGRIDAVIDVDLPRPRRLGVRDSEAFDRYAGQVRQLFLAQGVLREELPDVQGAAAGSEDR